MLVKIENAYKNDLRLEEYSKVVVKCGASVMWELTNIKRDTASGWYSGCFTNSKGINKGLKSFLPSLLFHGKSVFVESSIREVFVKAFEYDWKAGDVFRQRRYGISAYKEVRIIKIVGIWAKVEFISTGVIGTYSKDTLFGGKNITILTDKPKIQKPEVVPKPKVEKFILWSPESNYPPRVIMSNGLEAAKEVAVEMAERYSGQKFYVCQLLSYAQEVTVQVPKTTLMVAEV